MLVSGMLLPQLGKAKAVVSTVVSEGTLVK